MRCWSDSAPGCRRPGTRTRSSTSTPCLSRSTLYATCEPVGGVAALIQRRRLERIHAHLTDPGERRRISEIAFQYGFVSKAHFSRAFRNAFGCSPREARGGVPYTAEPPHPPRRYESWLRDLRG